MSAGAFCRVVFLNTVRHGLRTFAERSGAVYPAGSALPAIHTGFAGGKAFTANLVDTANLKPEVE